MDLLEEATHKLHNGYFVDLFVRQSNANAIGMYSKARRPGRLPFADRPLLPAAHDCLSACRLTVLPTVMLFPDGHAWRYSMR